jgi:Cu(I)/Ag(I) efflux system membrane fusion protein/cobalt-zinc-cadmium efflux system membrane fusion protein
VVTSGQFMLDSESRLREGTQKMSEDDDFAEKDRKSEPKGSEDDFFQDMQEERDEDAFFDDLE